MFGIFLAFIATFLGEISSSIGKWEVRHKKEDLYSMGFLNTLGSWIFFFIFVVCVERKFWINPAAWFWILLLILLAAAQAYFTVEAVAKAERSSFSFIRTGTIPLVLAFDLLTGYRLSPVALIGMALIVGALSALYMSHGISRRGLVWVALSAVNGAVVISLYKYLISFPGNSVSSLQLLIGVPQLILFYVLARYLQKIQPIRLLKDRGILAQMLSQGLCGVVSSFAFIFAPASVIVTAERSFSVIWAFLFGHKVFHERRFFLKGCVAAVILIGILLLPR